MIIRRALMAALLSAASFIGGYAKIGVQHQTVLGNPSNATTDAANSTNYLLPRDQYTISYNDARGVANWVSWNLTSEDVGGSGRSPEFFVDPDLPPTFSVVLTTDYQGSGYDRGHMCPSGDRTVSRADNDVTFYMSNMVPQTPDNNQGVWANFENYCRTLAHAGNEVLIVSGPSLFGGSTVPSGAADIPGYVWKVVVVVPLDAANPARPAIERINADTRVIAIKIPNIAGVRSDPWENYLVSPAVIEADTGFNFFRNLTPFLAGVLRNKVDGQTTAGLPVITTQPEFQAPALGGTATFTVAASSATPLTYQWFKGNDDIPGATNPTLTLTGVTLASAGSYYAVVTNAVGSTTSTTASLVISGLPPSITTNPTAPATSPAGSTVTLSVGVAGSPPFTYQWLFNGSPISEANGAALVLSNVQSAHTGAYEVIVGNGVETVMSAAANVVVTPAAPTFTTHPAPATATIGSSVTLTAQAVGTDPISYAWTRDGNPVVDSATVSGATTAALTLTNLTSGAAGSYRAIATNSVNSTTSNPAVLTVNAATILWNFDNINSSALPTSGLPPDVTGGALTRGNNNKGDTGTENTLFNTTSASTGSFSGQINAGLAARTDVQALGSPNKAPGGSGYFEFTLQPNPDKKLVISGISFGSRRTGTGPQAYSIFSSLDGFAAPIATGAFIVDTNWNLVSTTLTPVTSLTGSPLTVRIYGHGGTGGAQVNTTNWRIDDLRVTATTIASVGGTAPSVASVSPEPNSTGVPVTTPITVTFDQPVNVSSGWFSINSLLHGPISAAVTGGPTTFTLSPPVNFAFGDVITATIHGSAVKEKDTNTLGMVGNHTWSFGTVVPVTPGIVANPESITVADGSPATFTVLASGTGPLSYQWRLNGNPILTNPTATSSVLKLSPATLADAGTYSVVVTNPAGSATSTGASLAVTLVAPTFVAQPASKIVLPGASATFVVNVTGSLPMTFNWRRNGSLLTDSATVTGSNTGALTISNATADSIGSYDVVVKNAAGENTSDSATLGVTAAALTTAKWTFGTSLPGIAGPTTPLPVFVTGGNLTHGNNNGTTTLLTGASVSSGYTGASGLINAGAAARIGALNRGDGGSAYFQFTLTPTDGRQLVVTALNFGSRSTSTGPQAYTIFSSADNFAAPLATGNLSNGGSWAFLAPNLAAVRSLPNTGLTFRIYGHAGVGSPGTGTANWRIDDLSVTLGVELPPTVVSTSPLAGATGIDRGSAVSITFNQPVTLGANALTMTSAASGAVPFAVSGGPVGFTLTPAAPFNYGDTITVNVTGSAVRDSSGTLTMPGNHVFAFGTEVAVPPGFAQQPASQTVTAFDDVTFTVVASGTGPFSYEWRRNNVAITGNASAATASLQLPDVTTDAAGDYDCIVTGFAGQATSEKAKLTVNKATASVTLGALTHTFDGAPKSATATSNPVGLTLVVTYDGAATAPTQVGDYAVVATVQDNNYQGSASGNLRINPALATIRVDGLRQRYDGSPRGVSVTTNPSGLDVDVTYDGSATAPTLPGTYDVEVTIEDPNYRGAALQKLVVDITALVRHAPSISGALDGSAQMLVGEEFSMAGSSWMSGDLLAPGTPELRRSGNGAALGVKDAAGATSPAGYDVKLAGNALIRHLVRRVDALALPVVAAPAVVAGAADITVKPADGRVSLLAGNYGKVSLGAGTRLVLGVAGATESATYNLQELALGSDTTVEVVGPAVVTVARSVASAGVVGNAAHPAWLKLQIASGGLSLTGNAVFAGDVVAPSGTVSLAGNATLTGSAVADRLTITGNGLLEDPQ